MRGKPTEKGKMCSTRHPTKGCYLSHENDSSVRITEEEVAFGKAMEAYKRRYNRPYPNYREILYVAIWLGYKKVAPNPDGEKRDVEQQQ